MWLNVAASKQKHSNKCGVINSKQQRKIEGFDSTRRKNSIIHELTTKLRTENEVVTKQKENIATKKNQMKIRT